MSKRRRNRSSRHAYQSALTVVTEALSPIVVGIVAETCADPRSLSALLKRCSQRPEILPAAGQILNHVAASLDLCITVVDEPNAERKHGSLQ